MMESMVVEFTLGDFLAFIGYGFTVLVLGICVCAFLYKALVIEP